MRRTLYPLGYLAALLPGGVFCWLAPFLLAGPAWAQPGPSQPAPLYAVVFEATVNAAGKP